MFSLRVCHGWLAQPCLFSLASAPSTLAGASAERSEAGGGHSLRSRTSPNPPSRGHARSPDRHYAASVVHPALIASLAAALGMPRLAETMPHPWTTYADIAEQVVCPEHDRLLRAGVHDEARLHRSRTDCWAAIARDNPDLIDTLIAAAALPLAPPPPIPAELTPAQVDADVARIMPRLGPIRTAAQFLLADIDRCLDLHDDSAAAARYAAATDIARQLNATNTGLEWIVAEALYTTILHDLGERLAADTLGPACAQAALDLDTSYHPLHADHLRRAIAYDLAATIGWLRTSTTAMITRALALDFRLPPDGDSLPPSLWIAAAASHLRAHVSPIHALRHDALLRALAVPALHAGPARHMARMPALYTERYGGALDLARSLAAE